ncbi:MAG: 2-hydroxyacyl-CoA dehydratase subunit D [Candidatus Humimicrobiaceae bacterium]
MQIKKCKITDSFFKESLKSKSDIQNSIHSIGYLCTYIPEEILISGGLHSVRIKGDSESNLSDGYLPINFCPYIKAVWEEIHKKSYSLKSIIFATSCDGMKRLNDLFLNYKKENFSFMLDVPKNNDENSIEFYADRLKNLFEFVKTVSPRSNIGIKDLANSIEIINKKRKLLSDLTGIYESDENSSISTSQYFSILDIAASADNKIFICELENFLKNIQNSNTEVNIAAENKHNKDNDNIMVIGNYINDGNFWDIFTDLNIKVISGDLCISSRYFDFQVNLKRVNGTNGNKNNNLSPDLAGIKDDTNTPDNIFRFIAESYLKKPLCFRMTSLNEKLKSIKEKINLGNIKAVIFTSLKFCDNTLYFYPELKNELVKLNIPSLYLDVEYGKSSYGQLRTRIEAFYEMLF